jgi:integrase
LHESIKSPISSVEHVRDASTKTHVVAPGCYPCATQPDRDREGWHENTIGDVNKISLGNATKIARKHFAEARLGILGADKAKAKAQAAEARLTLARVSEQYLKAKGGVLSGGTHAAAARYFEKHWSPLLSLPLNRIERRIVAERLRELIGEHGPSSAGRARTNLSALFRWAMGEGLCDANPVIGTNDPEAGITPRQCVLEDEAIKAIWHACLDDDFGKIVKLLLLTGCRRDEIGALRWDEINLKTGMLDNPRSARQKPSCLAAAPAGAGARNPASNPAPRSLRIWQSSAWLHRLERGQAQA